MQQNPIKMEEREEEKRNKKAGMMVSVGLHALLLLAFLFILAWREPDPPLPEYGIELNFGMADVGTGEVQPEQPANPAENEEEAVPEELPEETIEQPVEEVEEVEPEVETVEEPLEEVVESVTNPLESPDVIPKEEKEIKKPAEETKKEEEKKEPEKPVETTAPPEKPSTGAAGTDGQSEEAQNANQGDDKDEQGDKGDEEGTLDARALYGQSGGGAGPALSIVGWTWDEVPNDKDASSENGTIIFKFTIDQDGYVIKVQTVESSVSPGVTKFYEDQLRQTTFSKTGTGIIPSATTSGTVTFVIKSK